MIHDRFASIREVLSREPSEENWKELLKHLRAWPHKEQKEMGVQYINAHLNLWPDELRSLSELAPSPYWQFIRCYEIRSKARKQTIAQKLYDSPYMEQIKVFKWDTGGPIDLVLEALLTSRECRNLKSIVLKRCELSDFFRSELERMTCEGSCSLESLCLEEVGRWDVSLLSILSLPPFAGLKKLTFETNQHFYNQVSLRELCEMETLPELEVLSLKGSLGHQSLEELPSRFLPSLRKLRLSSNPFTSHFEHFANWWPVFPALQFLDLSENPNLTLYELQQICLSSEIPKGVTIDVSRCRRLSGPQISALGKELDPKDNISLLF